jgi:hypothetical protein
MIVVELVNPVPLTVNVVEEHPAMTKDGETELTVKAGGGSVEEGLEEELPQPAAHSTKQEHRVVTTGPMHLMIVKVYSHASTI